MTDTRASWRFEPIPLSVIAAAYDSEGEVTAHGIALATLLATRVLPTEIGTMLLGRLRKLDKQVEPTNLDPNYPVARVLLRIYVRELLSLVPDGGIETPVCVCTGDAHVRGCPFGSPFEAAPKTAGDIPWWKR